MRRRGQREAGWGRQEKDQSKGVGLSGDQPHPGPTLGSQPRKGGSFGAESSSLNKG